jgi:hypothetical protein
VSIIAFSRHMADQQLIEGKLNDVLKEFSLDQD